MSNSITGDLLVTGQVRAGDGFAGLEREHIAQETTIYPLMPHHLRVWDNFASLPPNAGANDDLGLITGTLGTDSPTLQTGDLKAAGATTRYVGLLFDLPPEYIAGQAVSLKLHAGMVTTVADTTATIDAQVYLLAGDGSVGSDLCTTAAQDINNLTAATKTFAITYTTFEPGDVLMVRVAIAVNDGGTGTAVIGELVLGENTGFSVGIKG